jgi:hypothetical protein
MTTPETARTLLMGPAEYPRTDIQFLETSFYLVFFWSISRWTQPTDQAVKIKNMYAPGG